MTTIYGTSVGEPCSPRWNTAKMQILRVNLWYPPKRRKKEPQWAVRDVSLPLFPKNITALMGPSGCGKSTLIQILNNIHKLYPGRKIEGQILLDGRNILSPEQDVHILRARVGMVFQKPTPFPMSIYDNIAFGIRLYEKLPKSVLDGRVEHELQRAGLWNEVKERLNEPASELSGGQQQRLCIARTVAINPEVILFDEPCSALDRISVGKVEELIHELATEYTIGIVTHNEHQAARLADFIGFMYDGELLEFDTGEIMTMNPRTPEAQDYISGKIH